MHTIHMCSQVWSVNIPFITEFESDLTAGGQDSCVRINYVSSIFPALSRKAGLFSWEVLYRYISRASRAAGQTNSFRDSYFGMVMVYRECGSFSISIIIVQSKTQSMPPLSMNADQ